MKGSRKAERNLREVDADRTLVAHVLRLVQPFERCPNPLPMTDSGKRDANRDAQ